ncbi:hypothetical protein Pisl_1595 [Pyrobaculum islandicum DSM 4184]|uniref:Uncharacterized protein n=1 Tax=Pyrobaculum islandicum (strain DSM 4184 / JCM 9189 / GEO3) TaxID=384616 RepID=A1RUW7_PYRIL|nr:hypothetical protein Pisl_1595 [Pyrobaculum islandicum DSM 4184]
MSWIINMFLDGATQKFFKLDSRRLMRTLLEKLGPLAKILAEMGIDPHLPVYLLTPRIFTIAPKLVNKLADAS